MRYGSAQEVGLGHEVGVEDRDQLAGGALHRVAKGSCLVAIAFLSVEVRNIKALRPGFGDCLCHQGRRFISGVIEDLDLEQFSGVVQSRRSLDNAPSHVELVVDG